MPDQHSAASEHAIMQEITQPLAELPADPVGTVANVDFPIALRGYEREAVDEYVREVAQLVAELHATTSPEGAVRRALERVGEQVSSILGRAHETAEQITTQSRAEAEERLMRARAEAEQLEHDTRALAQRLEADARQRAEERERAAEQRVRELDAEVDRIWAERDRIVTDTRRLSEQLAELASAAATRFPAAATDEASAVAGEASAVAGEASALAGEASSVAGEAAGALAEVGPALAGTDPAVVAPSEGARAEDEGLAPFDGERADHELVQVEDEAADHELGGEDQVSGFSGDTEAGFSGDTVSGFSGDTVSGFSGDTEEHEAEASADTEELDAAFRPEAEPHPGGFSGDTGEQEALTSAAEFRAPVEEHPTAVFGSARIRVIDLHHLGRERVIGCWQVDDVLIDPGPASCLHTLLEALEDERPRALLLTHIHLDHAGATGSLVARWPELEVYVHELGAPHLIDPSRLLESARRLYGQDMDRLWGEFLAVPEDNLRILSGGEQLLEGRFEVAYTPGHASHHVCYLHEGTAFVGDVGGVRITPETLTVPPTPPPDIDIEAWHASIERVLEWRPERLAMTHFGASEDVEVQLAEVEERLDTWAALARTEDLDTFLAVVQSELERLASPGSYGAYVQAAPPEQLYAGLERYWSKRETTDASSAQASTHAGRSGRAGRSIPR